QLARERVVLGIRHLGPRLDVIKVVVMVDLLAQLGDPLRGVGPFHEGQHNTSSEAGDFGGRSVAPGREPDGHENRAPATACCRSAPRAACARDATRFRGLDGRATRARPGWAARPARRYPRPRPRTLKRDRARRSFLAARIRVTLY